MIKRQVHIVDIKENNEIMFQIEDEYNGNRGLQSCELNRFLSNLKSGLFQNGKIEIYKII